MAKTLIYYLYAPRIIPDIYDLHIRLLNQYIYIFDNINLYIGIDNRESNKKYIIDLYTMYLSKSNLSKSINIIPIENDPVDREGKCFKEYVIDKLSDYDIVLFGHGKGISNYKNKSLIEWINGLYYFNLNYIDDVEDTLINNNQCSYGSYFLSHSLLYNRFKWIYSGGFQWINCKVLKSYIDNNKINVDKFYNNLHKRILYNDVASRWFSEGFLGCLFPKELANFYGTKCYDKLESMKMFYNDYTNSQEHMRTIVGNKEYDKFLKLI